MADNRIPGIIESRENLADMAVEISVEEAHMLLQRDGDVTLIDVRERGPVLGYIRGATFIPLELLGKDPARLPARKDTPILVYCASGILSSHAVKTLKDMGYGRSHSIRGGFNAWRELGYEVVSDGELTADQLNRYSRNVLLEEIGIEGQLKLMNARVLLVGAGGLGCPAALYLAAAGIGTIGIADFDTVEISNLNRQVLHGVADVGRMKTDSARDAIYRLNPETKVITYEERLTSHNVIDIVKEFDVVADATDSVKSKFLLNDASFFAGKPYVFGGAVRFEGQAGVFFPKEGGPCLRCLFPSQPSERLVPT